jgi:hypothetical protein
VKNFKTLLKEPPAPSIENNIASVDREFSAISKFRKAFLSHTKVGIYTSFGRLKKPLFI